MGNGGKNSEFGIGGAELREGGMGNREWRGKRVMENTYSFDSCKETARFMLYDRENKIREQNERLRTNEKGFNQFRSASFHSVPGSTTFIVALPKSTESK